MTTIQQQALPFIQRCEPLRPDAFPMRIERLKQVLSFSGNRRRLWHEMDIHFPLPQTPCCYVVYMYGRVQYIGSTLNLRERIKKHRAVEHENWDGPDVKLKVRFPLRYGEWLMVEARLINRLQPPGNKKGIRRGKAVAA